MKTPREYREANVTYLVPPFTNTEDIFVRRYGLLPVVYKWKNVPTGRTGTHTVYLFPEDVKRFPNLLAHWNRTAEWKYTLTNSVLVVL